MESSNEARHCHQEEEVGGGGGGHHDVVWTAWSLGGRQFFGGEKKVSPARKADPMYDSSPP